MELFAIKNLSFTYPLAGKPALDGISFSVGDGEFITVCGRSGCGKSTLLRHLKTVLTPHGVRCGQICFRGAPLEQAGQRAQAAEIGFVLQTPDNQIVTDKVWHELAFGLESLGYDSESIRLRVAEMASFFGIQNWFMKSVSELSGGEKQLLNLASVMAMQPSALILDEPTSQLDPIAASDFLETVKKINRELGTTVVLTEQRLEEAFPMSDRVIVLDEGKIIASGTPQTVGEKLKKMNHPMFAAMPAPMRIYAGVESALPCPITVRDGRSWLWALLIEGQTGRKTGASDISTEDSRVPGGAKEKEGVPVIEMRGVWFRYERNLPDVVKDLSLEVCKGQLFCIVGGNGTGKTTALCLLRGILTPYRGKILINGKDSLRMSGREKFEHNLGMLPQNPQALFVKKTVELDLYEVLDGGKLSKEQKEEKVREISSLCELDGLLPMHPYDLSGGEQQRAALAKVLLTQPKILLLDEPTKGLDGFFKRKLAAILKSLTGSGVTVIMVSHDIEFCARWADECAMFFDGGIVTQNTPRVFFSGNSFYTTAANRMARRLFPDAVTAEDVINRCRNCL